MGWLPPHTDPVATLQDVLNFFGVATIEVFEQVGKERCCAFRQSAVHQADPYALLAWIRKGELALPAEYRGKAMGLKPIREASDGPIRPSQFGMSEN